MKPQSHFESEAMEDDEFVRQYDQAELEIAAEFFTNWLSFLTRGLCDGCSATLRKRIDSLRSGFLPGGAKPLSSTEDPQVSVYGGPDFSLMGIQPTGWDVDLTPPPSESHRVRLSWADMAQEDELEETAEEEKGEDAIDETAEAERDSASDDLKRKGDATKKETGLSREQREEIRFKSVGRKKDFICLERVKGKIVNILDGLELHTGVFSAAEQKRIVDSVYELQEEGKNHQFGEYTYSEPPKWMRGKGRVTIQFGCCYTYAVDKHGNPPSILKSVVADPIPHLFKVIIRRLIRWHVLPATCIPDSCIVNIYEPGDCIPPHIDSNDFVRPFCTVSFLSECSIVFGSNLQIAGPGEFIGSTAIPLPVGSVLVLNGNGADVAKHCVPAVPAKRISITFRKMDESKRPVGFVLEPDLQNIQPLNFASEEAKGYSRHDKNQLPAVESKSFKKGRNRGRSSAIKPGPYFQDNHHHSNDSGSNVRLSNRGILDNQSSGYNGSSHFETGSSSVLATESKRRPEFQSNESYDDRANEFTKSTSHRQQEKEVASNVESSREHAGRSVRLEQNRVIISRSMEEEDEYQGTMTRRPESTHVSRVHFRSSNNHRPWIRPNDGS